MGIISWLFDKAPKKELGFCGKCGKPRVIVVEPRALRPDGWMWEVRECPSGLGPYKGHDQKVLREWNEGPRFDRRTGERRRLTSDDEQIRVNQLKMEDEPICQFDNEYGLCMYCTGEACLKCDWCLPMCDEPCEHDVIDRHGGIDAQILQNDASS